MSEPAGQDLDYLVTCEKCGSVATTFSVMASEVLAHQKDRIHTEDPHVPLRAKVMTVDQILDSPSPAHWYITCDDHYPGDDAVFYYGLISTSRRAAVDLIRHMGEKEWVGRDTARASLAVRLLAPVEAKLPRGKAW